MTSPAWGIADERLIDDAWAVSFAVVDLETTGLHPAYHHRIVEVAIVSVGASGEIEDEWSTLVNPERDLGPSGLHGVFGSDVSDAPCFCDIAGEVLERLRGRIPVAHNARFDRAFIESEFARLAVDVTDAPWCCTLALSAPLVGGGRLADCCAAFGVELADAHTALGDARGCTSILRALLERLNPNAWPRPTGWGWPRLTRTHRGLTRTHRAVTREQVRSRPPAESFVGVLAARLDHRGAVDAGIDAASQLGYLDVLDRAVADRRINDDEAAELAAVAQLYSLDVDAVRQLHRRYVAGLLDIALVDHVVTPRERRDLELVAALLGVDDLDSLEPTSNEPRDVASLSGKTVCFTGALCCGHDGAPITRHVAQQLAEDAGLNVAARVTRDVDILVVADPDSLSAKARKAREYGTTVIAETAFWPLIGVEVN